MTSPRPTPDDPDARWQSQSDALVGLPFRCFGKRFRSLDRKPEALNPCSLRLLVFGHKEQRNANANDSDFFRIMGSLSFFMGQMVRQSR